MLQLVVLCTHDVAVHVTGFCEENFCVLVSDDVVVIETMFSHYRFFGLEHSDVSLMFFLMRSWMDRLLCLMYTLPYSQGILYMPGVLNPGASLIGGM